MSGFLISDVLGEKAAILGAIAGAQHVRLMAKHYGVPVVLHRWIKFFLIIKSPLLSHAALFSDHCAKKLLPWFDGMLEANEEYFK